MGRARCRDPRQAFLSTVSLIPSGSFRGGLNFRRPVGSGVPGFFGTLDGRRAAFVASVAGSLSDGKRVEARGPARPPEVRRGAALARRQALVLRFLRAP